MAQVELNIQQAEVNPVPSTSNDNQTIAKHPKTNYNLDNYHMQLLPLLPDGNDDNLLAKFLETTENLDPLAVVPSAQTNNNNMMLTQNVQKLQNVYHVQQNKQTDDCHQCTFQTQW